MPPCSTYYVIWIPLAIEVTERKVYKFRIDPTAEQEAALSRYAGARRFVFNWALSFLGLR
jgi:hypothetical protein